MKIAILHNFMDNIGGAEKLVLMLARELNADVITTNINQKAIKKFGFDDISIKSIGQVPLFWPYKQLKTISLFRSLKLNKYDALVISGEWALAAAKKNKPVLWYVHSLPRHIWDFYEQELEKQKTFIDKARFKFFTNYFKKFVKKYAFLPKIIAANSNNTQRKLITNIKCDSLLIYPPTDVKSFYFEKYGDFWLSVNRISENKRIELQLQTFARLPNKKLLIIGDAENTLAAQKYFNKLKLFAPANVEFLGEINDKKLKKLYATCTGFITTAEDEDFGMTPIEAMASGKPVVATNEGGYKESIDEETGILIESIPCKLRQAIIEICKNPEKYKKACFKKANSFSLENFSSQIKNILNSIS